jgi:hypothetical protein
LLEEELAFCQTFLEYLVGTTALASGCSLCRFAFQGVLMKESR